MPSLCQGSGDGRTAMATDGRKVGSRTWLDILKPETQKGFTSIIWTTMDMLHGIMLLQNMALSPSHDLTHLNQLIQLMAVSCFVSPHSRYGSCSNSDTLHFSPLLSLSLPPSPVIHSWQVKLTSNLAVLQCVINL